MVIFRILTRLRFRILSRTRRGRQRLFSDIYASNSWGSAESVSGSGSTLQQSAAIRAALPGLFSQLSIKVLLDAPCGDANWVRHISGDLDAYLGIDVVPKLVEHLNAAARDNETFLVADVVSDLLPRADAILCRDALVHMPLKQAIAALGNFRASGARYLIATTFPGRRNTELPAGHWRPLDLAQSPFDLGPPLALIDEECTEGDGAFADKSLGVWRL